jgi:energy-coupling factor transport system permease protein
LGRCSMSSPSEFELLGRVTIGQYLPTGSLLHQLDPRAKLLMLLLLTVAVIISNSVLGLGILLVGVMICLVLARVPLGYALDGLKPAIPSLLLLALLQVFLIPALGRDARVLWEPIVFTVTDRSILAGIVLIMRFAVMALGVSLLSFSTSTTELTHGVEHLLRPLQSVGLPAHEFALVTDIAIRFVPILAEETERLLKAQASRGADFGRGQRGLLVRARKLLPLLVPLFLVSLRRADQLVEAMEARCYLGGKGRTHLICLQGHIRDYGAVLATVVLVGLVVLMGRADIDRLILGLIAPYPTP